MDTCIDVISFLEWLSPFFLNTFISEETRGQTLTITPFLCMSFLKCECFVNSAI